MSLFTGSGVALITPFHDDLSINYEKIDELIEEQIAAGTDAIVTCGTTGESPTLTEDEHVEVIKFTCERVKGRIPVIAGTGSNWTTTAIDLSIKAQAAGVDGVMLVTPYYNKATQKGLIAHFGAIAEAVAVPVILYNIPGRTGVNMAPETVAQLVRDQQNIVGVKDATGDIGFVAQMMAACDGNVDLYSGNDDMVVPLLSLGGAGVISVTANIVPEMMHDMVMDYLKGDVKQATHEQLRLIPLCNQVFSEVNPIPIKTAMNLMNKAVGGLRPPLTVLEPHNVAALQATMSAMKLI